MYLRSNSFTDTDLHVHIGATIAFGITLHPVPPAVATRFRGLASAVEVDGRTASSHLAAALCGEATELARIRDGLDAQLRSASTDLANARRLASAPVCGDEAATIRKMIKAIDGVISSVPPRSTRVERLRKHLPAAGGLDVAMIEGALQTYDDEAAAIAQLRTSLIEVRDGLREAEGVASDPATLAGIAKIKANTKLARAVTPERVEKLERLLEVIKSHALELDAEIATIKKAAA